MRTSAPGDAHRTRAPRHARECVDAPAERTAHAHAQVLRAQAASLLQSLHYLDTRLGEVAECTWSHAQMPLGVSQSRTTAKSLNPSLDAARQFF